MCRSLSAMHISARCLECFDLCCVRLRLHVSGTRLLTGDPPLGKVDRLGSGALNRRHLRSSLGVSFRPEFTLN